MVEKRDVLFLIDHVNLQDWNLYNPRLMSPRAGREVTQYVTDKQNQHLTGHQI